MTRRKLQRWFRRTVRAGAVRLGGLTWRPQSDHRAYDGRLDGLRCVFYRYPQDRPLVGLWGTEAVALDPQKWPGADCVDGAFPWQFWHPQEV